MLLHKLKTVAAAALLIGALGGFGVWAHWPPHARANPVPNPAPATTPAPAPASKLDPASQPEASSPALAVSESKSNADCPIQSSDDWREYCPLRMAASTVSRVVSYFHESTPASK
jgi:hypothetical protein